MRAEKISSQDEKMPFQSISSKSNLNQKLKIYLGAQTCDKFQNELKARLIMNRKRLKRRKSSRLRLSSSKSCDQHRKSTSENCNQSTSANLSVTVVNDSSDDEDKAEKYSSNVHLRSNLNLTALKTRLSTIFHRFTREKSEKSKDAQRSPSSTPIRRNQTFETLSNYFRYRTSRQINFDEVRNELLSIQRFREGCDDDQDNKKKKI